MRIRPIHAGDFDAIAALTNHYIRETAIHFGDVPVTAEALCREWETARERFPALVATAAQDPSSTCGAEEERFLGYAKAGPWRTRAAYSMTAEVGIYVDPSSHGRGVGTALYAALIDACRERGFHALIGGITMPNDASVRLHERLGFVRIGVFPEVGRKFDRWHDVGFWQLLL